MKLAVRRTSTAIVAVATAGVSSLFLGVAPASAATAECGDVGALIAPGICEVTFTSGTASFTPTAQMTQLEVLLVGAGGNGANQSIPNTSGYAAAGGGGEVKVVDFTGATAPLNVTVPAPGTPGGVEDGTTIATVGNGLNGGTGAGGASGNGNAGVLGGTGFATAWGAGGGAGAAADATTAVTAANGGAGIAVNAIAPSGSLFSADTACYGGGGAVGSSGSPEVIAVPPAGNNPGTPARPAAAAVQGIPGCGGGAPTNLLGDALAAPAANSGGGAGGVSDTEEISEELLTGASGFVAIRWNAAPTLAATGGTLNPAQLSIGIAALIAGAALAAVSFGRKRRES